MATINSHTTFCDMSYEEKLEEAKRLYQTANPDQRYLLERLFPEIREREDERIRKVLIDYFNRYKEQEECGVKTFNGIPTDNILAWLEKQETSYTRRDVDDAYIEGMAFAKDELEKQCAQKITEWSEEDERLFNSLVWHLRNSVNNGDCKHSAGQLEDWLKSLKDRVGCEANCTTTKEWSERDKEEFQIAIDTLVDAGQHDSAHWLESLKQRMGWKPTEKQMAALEYYMYALSATEHKEILFGLYNDLKKLTE